MLVSGKYAEDCCHGFPDIPRAWQDVSGGVGGHDDGGRANVLVEAEDMGAVSGVHI